MSIIGFLSPLIIDEAVTRALAEDLGRAGDITATATVPADTLARAAFVARKPGVVCGIDVAAATFRMLDPAIRFTAHLADGAAVNGGETIAVVEGPARAVLSGERVTLNYMGRLSGIASATHLFASRIAHTKAKVTCTRKTTPGLRALEKYAVRCGGGINHRFGLDDAVLIKDNHIAVAGGVAAVLDRARAAVGHLVKIEIEVDTLDQLDQVIASGKADVVMLDNMTNDQLREGVRRIAGCMAVEASGGVTLDTIKGIAETGVDVISVGWITHSAPVLDIGLDIAM
jgi:nicotinate-nucleotide pyrophosphorylase (carboxylating)